MMHSELGHPQSIWVNRFPLQSTLMTQTQHLMFLILFQPTPNSLRKYRKVSWLICCKYSLNLLAANISCISFGISFKRSRKLMSSSWILIGFMKKIALVYVKYCTFFKKIVSEMFSNKWTLLIYFEFRFAPNKRQLSSAQFRKFGAIFEFE